MVQRPDWISENKNLVNMSDNPFHKVSALTVTGRALLFKAKSHEVFVLTRARFGREHPCFRFLTLLLVHITEEATY